SGKQRIPCPLHGCKRVYSDVSALETHIKEHEIPAQSIPGKVMLCSHIGCSGSFPDMQKLMEHIRHHHKLNIFFQCESCRTKLRSYRGLLTHLHSCSKVSRGKLKPVEPAAPPPHSAVVASPTPMDQQPSQPQSEAAPQPVAAEAPIQHGPFPAECPSQPAVPSVLTPCSLPLPGTSPPQLTDVAPPPPATNIVSILPPSLEVPKATVFPPEVQAQTETRAPEPVHSPPASAPQSPPGSAAVWKKSQGLTCSRRILWEHTRGRYTCVQCGHCVSNRKEMSQHISSHHSGSKPAEEMGNTANNA
uniref:Zinc finger protein 414 n=1 Tax=Salarias fasciatus TaxID=181472 RepID=A0A672F9V5_SALFA